MSPMQWATFNAGVPDQEICAAVEKVGRVYLIEKGINPDDKTAADACFQSQITEYDRLQNSDLNRIVAVHFFRPHEFDSDASNDEALAMLRNWFLGQSIDWRNGSQAVVANVVKLGGDPPVGSLHIVGTRKSVRLDTLRIIAGRRIAIEVEASNNLDNGIWTLRQAVKTGKADCGVMIVPWTSKASCYVDEGMALDRIDQEFDGATDLKDGPIYRLAIVRLLDVCRHMLRPKR
jgi:hypothetical protein